MIQSLEIYLKPESSCNEIKSVRQESKMPWNGESEKKSLTFSGFFLLSFSTPIAVQSRRKQYDRCAHCDLAVPLAQSSREKEMTAFLSLTTVKTIRLVKSETREPQPRCSSSEYPSCH